MPISDLITMLRRIQNKDAAETFDQATDSLEAIRDFIAAVAPVWNVQGLVYYGVVTAVPGANQFTVATLAGLGAGKFADVTAPYRAFVLRDAGGLSAAPQGEQQNITVYDTATGTFTTNAFTAAVAVDDEILIMHPRIAQILEILIDMDVPAANSANNVVMRDVIGNKTDTLAGTSILARLLIPAADGVVNVNSRDVIGNKADTALYAATATASIARYIKAILASRVIATGTLTASSTTVPADNTRAEAADFFNGCLLMPVAGAVAFQPREIVDFTNATGVFTLDGLNPFTAAPGLVAYVIIANQSKENLLQAIRGGAESLESLDDELDAQLDLARSPDSATTTTTGAEQNIYDEDGGGRPFQFCGGFIDLTALQAGDTLRIRIYAQITAAGGYIRMSDDVVNTYSGVQDPALKQIDGFFNVYGVRVSMQLTAGVNRNIIAEFFDAKPSS